MSIFNFYFSEKNLLHDLICKEESLFVLYAFGPCRSQCNQTFHRLLSRPGEGRGLLFDPKFWPPGYLVTFMLERYSKCPVQKVHACDCFLNNSTTKGDKDMRFSALDTRDSTVWRYTQIWLVYLLTNRILAYFHGQ